MSDKSGKGETPSEELDRLLADGDDHMAFGEMQDAISEYTKAIKLDPKCAEAYGRRAGAKEELNDPEGALADYDAAIELDQTDADNYHYRGLLRYDKYDITGALTDCDRAIKIDDNDERYYSFRAQIRRQAGDFEGAISDCERIFALRPARTWIIPLTLCERGMVKAALGDVKGALKDMDDAIHAIKGGLGHAEIRLERGKVRLLGNDLDGAEKDLVAVAGESPSQPTAHVILAMIKLRKGKPDDAIFDLDQAHHRSKNNKPVRRLVTKAMKLLKQGDAEAALKEIGAHPRLLGLHG